MKDSGVEWIGEIPEHWEVRKLKHITNQIIDGTHFTPTYIDDGINFLTALSVAGGYLQGADLSNILIYKQSGEVVIINLKKFQKY